jgi:hypothetical protein
MREFIFPGGDVWIPGDSQELSLADLGEGDRGLLVFTDEDLATTYAHDNGLVGKVAKVIRGHQTLFDFLNRVKKLGVTHLVVDHSIGKTAHATPIDKAIRHAEEQIKKASHDNDD